SSRRRHTRFSRDWSSDVCSSDLWDINQLYNLETDPYEVNNLIRDPAYQSVASELNSALWDWLEHTDGTFIPLKRINAKHKDHKRSEERRVGKESRSRSSQDS